MWNGIYLDYLLPPATKFRQGNVLQLYVILFTMGLCPSMHHRSHDQGVSVQGGLCPGGLCPRGSLSRRSLYGGLCPGGSVLGRPPVQVRILLECILVKY